MLDLSKPVGQVDGIPVFADHEQRNVAYYLPDEIDLRMLGPDRPDISLHIFYSDQATVGSSASLEKAVGSILSVGGNAGSRRRAKSSCEARSRRSSASIASG